MKLVLINDKDILLTGIHDAVIGSESLVDIDPQFVEEHDMYETYIAYNHGKFEKVEGLKVKIPTSLFKELNVIIRVKMVKKTDKSMKLFESDNLPVARYISFGPYIEKAYPNIIAELQSEVIVLKRKVAILENQGDLF
jgi:hypothetical protein